MAEHKTLFRIDTSHALGRAPEETHEMQRDRMLERLERGICFVEQVWHELESLPSDLTLEQLDTWIEANRQKLHHELPYDKRARTKTPPKILGGVFRISGAAPSTKIMVVPQRSLQSQP